MHRLLVLLVLAVAACNNSPRSQSVRVLDSAGIRIVENFEPLWTQTTAWHMGQAPSVSIRAADEIPPPRLSVRWVVS